ncbi:MAG: hypothetical protein AB1523_12875 [Bacillota bacterium]
MTEVLSSAFLTSGKLLLRTLPVIILGVILGEFLISLKLVEKLSFLAKPITNFSHLRHECGISFITAFASPAAANSMLARYQGLGIVAAQLGHSNAAYAVASGLLSSGEISAKGVVLSLLAGDVLSGIAMMFRYLMPYYVGIFGLRTGLELMGISVTIRNGIVIAFILVLALFW